MKINAVHFFKKHLDFQTLMGTVILPLQKTFYNQLINIEISLKKLYLQNVCANMDWNVIK